LLLLLLLLLLLRYAGAKAFAAIHRMSLRSMSLPLRSIGKTFF
jgi:hypothetical protein